MERQKVSHMKDNKMHNSKKKLGSDQIITCLIVLIVLVTGFMSFRSYYMSKKAQSEYEALREAVVEIEEPVEEEKETVEEEDIPYYPQLSIDFASLKETNADLVGWLYFPALEISYPLVQGEDNSYYLKHSFEGEKNSAGCIFLDCEASTDFSDRNTFVFGHNMRDGSMFGSMKQLLNGTASCEEEPYFYIYTEETVCIYHIFSYYKTNASSDRYATFSSDESYDAYVAEALELTEFTSDCDLSTRGNIVSLSTCYGAAGTSTRNLLHGMLEATVKVADLE